MQVQGASGAPSIERTVLVFLSLPSSQESLLLLFQILSMKAATTSV